MATRSLHTRFYASYENYIISLIFKLLSLFQHTYQTGKALPSLPVDGIDLGVAAWTMRVRSDVIEDKTEPNGGDRMCHSYIRGFRSFHPFSPSLSVSIRTHVPVGCDVIFPYYQHLDWMASTQACQSSLGFCFSNSACFCCNRGSKSCNN